MVLVLHSLKMLLHLPVPVQDCRTNNTLPVPVQYEYRSLNDRFLTQCHHLHRLIRPTGTVRTRLLKDPWGFLCFMIDDGSVFWVV